MSLHPDFFKHAENQWSGPLQKLFVTLDREARADLECKPWRVLPAGAFVKLRFLEDGRREVRIARTEKPKTAKGMAAFARETKTFMEYFNIAHWQRTEEIREVGVLCILTEPEPIGPYCGNCGGTKDSAAINAGALTCTDCMIVAKAHGLVPCDRCGKLVPKSYAFDVMHCGGCAVAVGRETTALLASDRILK